MRVDFDHLRLDGAIWNWRPSSSLNRMRGHIGRTARLTGLSRRTVTEKLALDQIDLENRRDNRTKMPALTPGRHAAEPCGKLQ